MNNGPYQCHNNFLSYYTSQHFDSCNYLSILLTVVVTI